MKTFASLIFYLIVFAFCLLSETVTGQTYFNPDLGSEPNYGNITGAQLAVDSICMVRDEVFYDTTTTAVIENTYSLQNLVFLEWIPQDSIIINEPFQVALDLEITATDSSGADSVYFERLEIFHDTIAGTSFQHRDIFKLLGYHMLSIKILGVLITADSLLYNDILNSVVLTGIILVERSYRFDCSELPDVVHTYDANSNEINIFWNSINGANEYDLEWTFYDDSTLLVKTLIANPGSDFYYGFKNNCTRVSMSGPIDEYNIGLIYPSGYLFYRVRAVQVLPSGQRLTAAWSSDINDYYVVNWHEDSLNWQSSITFSEDGKRKQVVSYLDGTLRDRQSVTKNNSLNIDIIGSTLYDHYGRKAVNVLPTPTDTAIIQYFSGINKLANGNTYKKADFDTGGCGYFPPPMDSISGAAKYYSSSNEFLTATAYIDDQFNQFIPRSEGYVFGITQFTQDNTNRITRQSAPGAEFNLGSEHNTKYFYGKANQPEIDRLFGNDVGFAEYYNKNMVVDANGQASITFIDDKGRTIATALAGSSPDNLIPLNSNLTPDTITFSLLDNNQIENSTQLFATYTLLVPEDGNYFFNFEQEALEDSILNCDSVYICYDCLYDLEINITSACESDITLHDTNFVLPIKKTNLTFDGGGGLILDTICNNVPDALVDTFTVNLRQGSYHISKTLKISDLGLELYKERYLVENTCKSLEDFQDQFQNEIDYSGCQVDCESCMAAIGDSATYVQNYLQDMIDGGTTPTADDTTFIIDDYFNNLSVCDRLCDPEDLCYSYFQTMLADISPGGQYFIYLLDTISGNYSAPNYASVLYSDYQGIIYHYPNGNPITVEYNGNDVSPAALPLQEYIEGFQESWAINLVRAHPEYCYYTYCKVHNDANIFAQNMINTNNFYAALDSGYLNPSGASFSLIPQTANDPLFNGPNEYTDPIHVNWVNDSLLNYQITSLCTLNIWEIAYSIVDTSFDPCTQVIDTTWSLCNADLNMFWHLVRSMYLGIRSMKYYEVWGHHAQANNCCNNCIGSAINTIDTLQTVTFIDEFDCTASSFCPPRDYSQMRKIFRNIQVDSSTIPTSLPGGLSTGNAGIAAHCATVCDSYITEIYSLIQQCDNYLLSDTNDILNAFRCICADGCDLGHPMGSNDLPSGGTPCTMAVSFGIFSVSSFEDILVALGFAPGDTLCNPYSLALPAPYEFPTNNGPSIIFDTIPPCICEKLDTLYQYYDMVDSAGIPTFINWLNDIVEPDMLEVNLEYMMDRCDSTLDSCDFPLEPFEIPYELECETCVFCNTITAIADDFFSVYPGALAVNDFNNIFATYMNHHVGFNLTHTEYMDFLTNCGYLWPVPDCSDLQDHVDNYFDSLSVGAIQYVDISLYLNHYLNQFYTPFEYSNMFNKCGIVLGTMPDTLSPSCYWLENAVSNYINHHDSILTPEIYSDMVLFIMNNYGTVFGDTTSLLIRLNTTCASALPSMVAPVNCNTLSAYLSTTINPLPSRYFQLNKSYNWNYSYIDYFCWFHYCGISYDSLPQLDCNTIQILKDTFDLLNVNVPYSSDSLIGYIMDHYVFAFSVDSLISFMDDSCHRPIYPEGTCDSLQIAINSWLPYSGVVPIEVYLNNYFHWDFSISEYNLWFGHCGIPIERICNRPLFPPIEITDNCDSSWVDLANSAAAVAYEQYLDSLVQEFDNHYISNCLKTIELFSCKAPVNEYHYTLYYYDQGGNLVRTVPPAGVVPLNSTQITNTGLHRTTGSAAQYASSNSLYTEYFYNSFNKVHKQITPDAGKSFFWYDLVGRLVMSQNAQHQYNSAYSYSKFDNLSRLIESGKIFNTGMNDAIAENTSALASFILGSSPRTEVTHTIYDADLGIGFLQNNLRNRVGAVLFQSVYDSSLNTYESGIHYSYDILGNVSLLINDRPNLNPISHRFKTVDYKYDLVSGNVNEVIHQKGFSDQFIHFYDYDADNRLKYAFTSTDDVVWDLDGWYRYYYHGPMARLELGTYSVQGIDHFYTLQGWLKGKNASVTTTAFDMFNDGDPYLSNPNVSYDALAFSLNYFNGDYEPIGTANNPEASDASSLFENSSSNLYNGNIQNAIYSIKEAGQDLGYAYSYDQLNRYRRLDVYSGLQPDMNQWGGSTDTIRKYHESVNYDANGNIIKYLRHGDNNSKIQMDSMSYYYISGKNQLKYVTDSVPASDYADIDIDSQPSNNYSYDLNGNLITDLQEGLEIEWYNNGKIKHIQNDTSDVELYFYYDPMGRRIEKKVIDVENLDTVRTLYSLDAQGNTLAIYQYRNSDSLWLKDFNIYGSARIGQYSPDSVIYCNSCLNIDTIIPVLTMGSKQYELTNHLGNVMATISDKKIFQLITTGPLVYTWKPEVLSWQDYYPFGMVMPGRSFSSGNYRFGFNNVESLDELKGKSNHYEFSYREYDPRLGKFWSIDPIAKDFPWNSTYAFAENRVIDGIDLEGLEWIGALVRVLATDASKISLSNSQAIEGLTRVGTEIAAKPSKFTPEQLANFKRGNFHEAEQLAKNGLEKNKSPIDVEIQPGEVIKTIPDAFKNGGKSTSEIKNVTRQSFTKQLKAQEKFSNDNGLRPELIINKGAKLSKPLLDSSFDIKYYTLPPIAPADNTNTNYPPIGLPSSKPQTDGPIEEI